MQFSYYTDKTVEQILNELHVTKQGLSEQEAKNIKQKVGLNVLSAHETHWWNILLNQFKSPFLYLLIAAALLAYFLGEKIDCIMIFIFVGVNALLGFYQEYRSEKTLQFLKQYVIAKTKVIREGKEIEIQSKELVPGDIIILEPGNIVAADVRIIENDDLLLDESVLTGEAIGVKKTIQPTKSPATEFYNATNICFSGTTVISGKGIAVVINTGKNTALGNITSLTVETKHESSFEKSVYKFSKFILQIIVGTLLLIFVINIIIKGTSVDIPKLVIFAIALAVSVIPEALPVVITFSLSRGAKHLAKHHVVVKRLSAIEDLGSIEVLCTDKTGTITENKLSVQNVFPTNSEAVFYGSLAIAITEKSHKPVDSFDIALIEGLGSEEKKAFDSYERIKELPFDPERKRNSVLVKKNDSYELIVRGAAETILHISDHYTEKTKSDALTWIKQEGEQGRRVIAVARKKLIKNPADLLIAEKDLEFVGLVSFIDPIKNTVHNAITTAKTLGVTIKILTGDSREVAGSVATTIGLSSDISHVLTGDEFDKLPTLKQHEAVKEYAVFARVSPQQKHKIIKLLEENYEVGFLGDGINDAPALKAANVAIVVQGATDIAREAADIILLNKSLHTIIDGIREGRETFTNTTKYIKATLASNFGNFYTVAIASLFINYLPLLPLQILLLNLLTDSPMIAVAGDNVDLTDLKTPRNYDIKEIALVSTILGTVSSVFDFVFFVLFYRISPQVLQTNWFVGSVLTELIFMFSVRTRYVIFKAKRPSATLTIISVVAAFIAIILPFTPFGHTIFEFITPSVHDILVIGFVAFLYFISTEFVKLLYYRYIANGRKQVVNMEM